MSVCVCIGCQEVVVVAAAVAAVVVVYLSKTTTFAVVSVLQKKWPLPLSGL